MPMLSSSYYCVTDGFDNLGCPPTPHHLVQVLQRDAPTEEDIRARHLPRRYVLRLLTESTLTVTDRRTGTVYFV